MDRIFVILGALSGALGVALGAFGAHTLRGLLSQEALATFETAVRYQMYHALGLMAVAWVVSRSSSGFAMLAGWFFVAGTLMFSGSLYLLVISGQRWLAAVTPFGGAAFIFGWLLLAWSAIRA